MLGEGENVLPPALTPEPEVRTIALPAPPFKRKPLNLTLEAVREAFAAEKCELLTTEYVNSTTRFDYTFEGAPYHIQCWSWFVRGRRPHATKGATHKKKYSRESLTGLFANEGCELLVPEDWIYESNQQPLRYRFNGREFITNVNRWCNFNHRPHIGAKPPVIPKDLHDAITACGYEVVSYDKKTGSITFKQGPITYTRSVRELLTPGVRSLAE
jgi:hypothetical protein